jgi:hypothetical protein
MILDYIQKNREEDYIQNLTCTSLLDQMQAIGCDARADASLEPQYFVVGWMGRFIPLRCELPSLGHAGEGDLIHVHYN